LPLRDLEFAWDPAKARANRRKHGVCFSEAATVFADDAGQLLPDPDHPRREDRFVLLGRSAAGRLLVVVHAYRQGDSLIRVISARRATAAERRRYGTGWKDA
jgi:uncharacterized DUF497 family protein